MTRSWWKGDKLNRQADADHLRRVLLDRYQQRKDAGLPASYILNLDAEWGQGKTFFLQRLKMDLESDGHPVCYVNAWQDDLSNEPLVSIMAAIETSLTPYLPARSKARRQFARAKQKLGVVAIEASKQVALHSLKIATGISGKEIAKALGKEGEDAKDIGDTAGEAVFEFAKSSFAKSIEEHRNSIKAVAAFKENLEQVIEAISTSTATQKRAPLFVLIDELDRCRPLYAIRLLEDAKHLFQVAGVVFVIATDSAQLASSIKAIYGSEFRSREYLRRFFDRTYVFPHADRADWIRSVLKERGIDIDDFASLGVTPPIDIIRQWSRGFAMSLRDMEQAADIIETFVTSWNHSCRINIFILLMNVYAFQSQSSEAWVFADFIFEELTDRIFKSRKFNFKQMEWDKRTRGHTTISRVMSGEQLFRDLCQTMTRGDRPDFGTNAPWEQYLIDDPVWKDAPFNKRRDILREYTSRVWNAGRAIDRPAAY